jgi:hypothetical protein
MKIYMFWDIQIQALVYPFMDKARVLLWFLTISVLHCNFVMGNYKERSSNGVSLELEGLAVAFIPEVCNSSGNVSRFAYSCVSWRAKKHLTEPQEWETHTDCIMKSSLATHTSPIVSPTNNC